jgi:hypothetical protein
MTDDKPNHRQHPDQQAAALAPLEVDPEFLFEVHVDKKLFAYLMGVPWTTGLVEYWVMKSGWTDHSPGKAGEKIWTYTPVARKGATRGEYKYVYPQYSSEYDVIKHLFSNFVKDGDTMRRHAVGAIALPPAP